ncbi:MAG TPA: multifunctional oxoglutarate decarboxylase/oxoglutarate dehydrogenase thiamine pyrophosphate-binding subunit/dihydrolipoyllysine-residue succinyltransferase subunit [Gemmatimonadales bacterium]|jgi:2-oxoglutarate dehydrogenase E1 component
MMEFDVVPVDPELPDVAVPAELMYQALLEEQAPVPFESRRVSGPAVSAPNDAPAAAPTPTVPVPANAVQLKGPALKLAQNMEASLALPVATTFRDIPVRVLEGERASLNARLKSAGRPEKLSFTHLIGWALVKAAQQFPMMGTSVLKSGGDSYKVVPEHVNLGLAVDVERKDGSRGLVVPVLKKADTHSFAEYLGTYEGLVDKARHNKLMPDDFAGATMTLTNPGGLGTVASVPRLMPGQGTIIATGSIAYPPEFSAMDPGAVHQLGISKIMTMTSTYDHRVIQGAESGSYLRLVDQLLQGDAGFYHDIGASLGLGDAPAPATPAPTSAAAPALQSADPAMLSHVAAAMGLVKAFRTHGHLAANLDPLGTPPPGDPALDPAAAGLTPAIMKAIPASVLDIDLPGASLADVLPKLEATYCGTIAYEVEHLASHERRHWLHQQIESGAHRAPLSSEESKGLLARLTAVEGMEHFLDKAYLGAKRFSIEGVDIMVPMLDLVVEISGEAGIRHMVLGMAHRGRLNVLAHTVGRPYEVILAEFEGNKGDATPDGGTGDVKYHHGADGAFITKSGRGVTVTLIANPSHLEFVDPVVTGRARAEQTDRHNPQVARDPSAALPVTIHGDAAFPGQGVVAETLNLSNLDGYSTGGTLHIIANNQIGFTTDPGDGRSTRYSSDLAKGFDIPIIHVNADDAAASLAAVRLAMAYRLQFHGDVLIDLIGYRRHGHNETDEASFTQPIMAAAIKAHPTLRQLYATSLEQGGVIAAGEADALVEQMYQRLLELQTRFRDARAEGGPPAAAAPIVQANSDLGTGLSAETLTALNDQLLAWPADFTVHPKVNALLQRRRTGLTTPGGIDWGHAEALALASLLTENVPVRLTGQDVGRGTFSHRHIVLHDASNGHAYSPMQAIPGARATLEVHNSPLSELATIGFEYGYALAASDTLVLWEAQYGDFVNGAQVMLDQFIASGLSKWGVTSRLTLLLPHGYEGSGPEHSSGRVERFLQAAAEGNIRVANCTTPAQYFHLLRRQAHWSLQRPLVMMTPKSKLRSKDAGSSLADFTTGSFRTVLDDGVMNDHRASARALVLCSGKVYYDLLAEATKRGDERPPIARVEQLYPFPDHELRDLLSHYPSLTEVVWTQEEPRNMGPWTFMEQRLSPILPPGVYLRYVGRPERAAPSEGYSAAHNAEQARIVAEALSAGSSPAKARV